MHILSGSQFCWCQRGEVTAGTKHSWSPPSLGKAMYLLPWAALITLGFSGEEQAQPGYAHGAAPTGIAAQLRTSLKGQSQGQCFALLQLGPLLSLTDTRGSFRAAV